MKVGSPRKKIRTVFGSEWLINETSLAQFIAAEPIVTGDASDATSADMCGDGDANPRRSPMSRQPDTSDDGDASDAIMRRWRRR